MDPHMITLTRRPHETQNYLSSTLSKTKQVNVDFITMDHYRAKAKARTFQFYIQSVNIQSPVVTVIK